MIPGEYILRHEDIVLNADREAISLEVTNTGDRPVQVGSHYHFYEVNPALSFEREQAYGMRLDIPSGTAVRFEPGMTRTVKLIPYSGQRFVMGFRGQVQGLLDAKELKEAHLGEH